MAYTHGVQWTDAKIDRLRQLSVLGYRAVDIAVILTAEFKEDITVTAVQQAKYKHPLTANFLELSGSGEVEYFEADTLPDDDYMISADAHCPYHSELYFNRLLMIADIFGIKKHVAIGDLFDSDWAKFWPAEEATDLDREIKHTNPVLNALGRFEMNYLVQGNHEDRINRQTERKIQARHLFALYGNDAWKASFRYTAYDKVFIGDEWMLVHPKSYSRIAPQVARQLAEKYHRNVINSHGHIVGMGFEKSGKFLCVDMGGMFDVRKISYINKHTTTHPMWGSGFGILRNNKFWHFTDMTDWGYWEAQVKG